MTTPFDPNAALEALLSGAGGQRTEFPPESRYHRIATATWRRPDGTQVAYLRRRFIPPPDAYVLLEEHVVVQGERLDLLAAAYLGDPEQFWRICDANAVILPKELEEPGQTVRITLPAGVPGAAPG